jgi:hypothetical protein
MRTVSESKFARLKNRKGVTVKRKLGAQKLTKTSKSAVPDNMPNVEVGGSGQHAFVGRQNFRTAGFGI